MFEGQEVEEKIMKNLRLREASVRDIDQIRTLYWRLLDSSPKYGQVLQWKKNIYPNDDDWNAYIVKGEMYLILQDVDVIGAAPDEWFSHLAIEVPGENGSNEWLEPVSDEEYGKL